MLRLVARDVESTLASLLVPSRHDYGVAHGCQRGAEFVAENREKLVFCAIRGLRCGPGCLDINDSLGLLLCEAQDRDVRSNLRGYDAEQTQFQ
jgi:hypothetical protein